MQYTQLLKKGVFTYPITITPLTTTTTKCNTCIITNKTTQRISIFIHPEIAVHARAQAVVERLTLTALIEKALLNYLPKETIIKKIDAREPVVRQ